MFGNLLEIGEFSQSTFNFLSMHIFSAQTDNIKLSKKN